MDTRVELLQLSILLAEIASSEVYSVGLIYDNSSNVVCEL
jgi:hypothetical protein